MTKTQIAAQSPVTVTAKTIAPNALSATLLANASLIQTVEQVGDCSGCTLGCGMDLIGSDGEIVANLIPSIYACCAPDPGGYTGCSLLGEWVFVPD